MSRVAHLIAAFVLATTPIGALAANEPTLLYASARAGANNGWEGSATKGSAITVWGYHFGSRTAGSKITVAGQEIASTDTSNVAEWGATTHPTTAKGMQRITVAPWEG